MFRFSKAALIAVLATALAIPAGRALAQFGGIFGNAPPRPPGSIAGPDGSEIVPEPEEEDVPDLPQGRVLPTPQRLPPPPSQAARPAAPPPAGVQSQPLPPPPGAAVAPASPQPGAPTAVAPPTAMPGQPPLAGLPPGQRQPRGTPGSAPPPPATVQPGDEIVTEPPAVKIANKAAVFSGLDKVTGRIIKFDAEIGETVQFGALRVTPRVCYTRPPTEAANTDAFIEVEEITLQGEVKKLFSGWMFAASPGLNAVEHPIYDVWLNDCKGPDTAAVAATPAATPAAEPAKPAAPKPAAQPAQKRQPTAQQQRPPGPPVLPTPFPSNR